MKIIGQYILFSFLLITLSGTHSKSQDIVITTSLSADTILIGDQIYYSLQLKQPASLNITFPQFTDTLAGNIEILEKSEIDTLIVDKEQLILKQELLITCFDSGLYKIPGGKFTATTENLIKEFISDEIYLQVLTMPLDTSQAIFDIKLPYGAPVQFIEVLPYILGVLIIAAILFAAFWFIRKRKRKKQVKDRFKPLVPPHITALQELDKVKEERLWQNNREKEYYSRLTEILRIYLEGRYGIYAMEQTSDEILDSLKTTGFNDNRLFDKLRSTLTISDLAKFAKLKPSPNENEACLLDAYVFVNDTKISIPDPIEIDETGDQDSETRNKPEEGGSQDLSKDKTNHEVK
ncbi:MAG: hypothetical protein U9N53_00075 [Bacteroidota bacterium]|nr:hypothetical protein [Bacteroidota bacterium]